MSERGEPEITFEVTEPSLPPDDLSRLTRSVIKKDTVAPHLSPEEKEKMRMEYAAKLKYFLYDLKEERDLRIPWRQRKEIVIKLGKMNQEQRDEYEQSQEYKDYKRYNKSKLRSNVLSTFLAIIDVIIGDYYTIGNLVVKEKDTDLEVEEVPKDPQDNEQEGDDDFEEDILTDSLLPDSTERDLIFIQNLVERCSLLKKKLKHQKNILMIRKSDPEKITREDIEENFILKEMSKNQLVAHCLENRQELIVKSFGNKAFARLLWDKVGEGRIVGAFPELKRLHDDGGETKEAFKDFAIKLLQANYLKKIQNVFPDEWTQIRKEQDDFFDVEFEKIAARDEKDGGKVKDYIDNHSNVLLAEDLAQLTLIAMYPQLEQVSDDELERKVNELLSTEDKEKAKEFYSS